MANEFLALSMFIMLLSFFIVLNTMSTFEDERSKPVLSSVVSVFGSKPVVTQQPAPSPVQAPEESREDGDAMDKLRSVFTARIAVTKAQKNRFGTSMVIELPVDEFEKNVLNAGRAETPLTETLISVLQTADYIPYRMDIILGVGENPAKFENRNPRAAEKAIKRVASFTEALEDAGMPRKLISAGLGEGSSDIVELHFTRYDPLFLRAVPVEKTVSPEDGAPAQNTGNEEGL